MQDPSKNLNSAVEYYNFPVTNT